MQAELIAIGDEILIGQTVDTNSAFIARQLAAVGIAVRQKRVIADTAEAITEALGELQPDTQLVFMTGGLGPTKDDITKGTLLDFFGGELVFHPEVYAHIEKLFAGFNREPQEVHRQQAYLPTSCRPLINKMGTAAGMHFQKDGRHFFSTPGVPYETEHLVQDHIIPWVVEHLSPGDLQHSTLLTQGIPESDLAERLKHWEEALPPFIKLAYLPSPGLVKLRLTARHRHRDTATEALQEQTEQLKALLGEDVFGEEAQSLEEIIGILLRANQWTLATAESCTGGYIAHLITSVAGSSDYFPGGVVSYSNRAKQELLGVSPHTLANYGAVSEATVIEMAEGARRRFRSDFALATSGIAGPGGGSEHKPVGTIWIALASANGTQTRRYVFGRNRQRNIRKTALMALDLLRRAMNKKQKAVVE